MAEIINLEKLNEGLNDLSDYFESKHYYLVDIVNLCSQIILIETTKFSCYAVKEKLLKQK